MFKSCWRKVGSEVVSIYDSRQTIWSLYDMPPDANGVALLRRPLRISSGGRGACYGILFSNFSRQGGTCSVS